jgi:molybdenum cofactor sulfurtransferase
MSLMTYASYIVYCTLLDTAAPAPSSKTSLRNTPAGAMAVQDVWVPDGSRGFDREEILLIGQQRPWFAGGTADVVQVPGVGFTVAQEVHE